MLSSMIIHVSCSRLQFVNRLNSLVNKENLDFKIARAARTRKAVHERVSLLSSRISLRCGSALGCLNNARTIVLGQPFSAGDAQHKNAKRWADISRVCVNAHLYQIINSRSC